MAAIWLHTASKVEFIIVTCLKHGGKYLSRSGNIEMLEGDPNDINVVALIEFPSGAALKAFVNDPEYAPYAKARQAGTDSRLYMIDDSDATGGIPYLPAG